MKEVYTDTDSPTSLDLLLRSTDIDAIRDYIDMYNVAIDELIQFGKTKGVSDPEELTEGGFLSGVLYYESDSLGAFIKERARLETRLNSLERLESLLRSTDITAINAELGKYNYAIEELKQYGDTKGVDVLAQEREQLLDRLESLCEDKAQSINY